MDSFRGEPVDLGSGYTVQFLFTGSKLHCEWSPRIPRGRKGRRLLPAYRAARETFVRSLANREGINVAVVEV